MLFDSAGIYEKPDWDTNLFMSRHAGATGPAGSAADAASAADSGLCGARHSAPFKRSMRWVIQRALDTMLTGQDATDSLLPQLKMPVLILWGEEDRITPLEQGEKMHSLVPQSELDVFDGCGHLAPEQCTAEMGPAGRQFVQSSEKRKQPGSGGTRPGFECSWDGHVFGSS